METINLLLVDDHQIIRDGIKAMLQNEQHITIKAEASTVEQAIQIITQKGGTSSVNMIISDVAMIEQDGIALLKKAKTLQPSLPFLFLASVVDEGYALKALEFGAEGYLPKDVTLDILLTAIRTLHQGDIYYHKKVSDIIIKTLLKRKLTTETVLSPSAHLTQREKEILTLVVRGMSNALIAQQLTVSVRTIENHRANILRKINVKNTAELVRYALQYHLLD